MKKSTLFFKVMVLMALLVPWTSWGQSQLPEGIDENDVIADKIMVLDSNGEIPGDNSGATEEQKGKNVKLETFHFKTGYDYNDWTFVNEVKPSDSGITVKIQGGNTMLSLSGSPKSEVDAIYIKIKNTEGDEKWVRYGFVQSGSSVISASYTTGGDSKVYNGRNISEEEVKVGLKVVSTKYEIGQDNEETTLTTYSVTIPDNAKNVGTYEITITAEGSTATVEYEITKRPVTVTLEGLELKKGANGTNLKASDYASYFKFEEENTQDKSGLVSGEKAKVTGTFDIDTQTVGDASFSTDDLDVVADNSSFASENYTIKWDGKATITKKDFSEGGEGGQGGTIIVTVVDKTYDGKPVDSPVVKDGETSLGKDAYVVEYYQGDTKLESAPIHAGEYKVVITPIETSDYDTESSITKDFTIKAAEITLTGSVTVEQGESLLGSYDIEDLDNDKVNVTYEEGSSAIEGLTLTFKAAVTPTKSGSELTQQPSDNVPNAFNVQQTEGDKDDWLITISNTETTTYKPGDITIKAITITLIVEAKKVDWTDESNQQKEVTVYVNKEGQLKYGEDGEYGTSVDITLNGISELAGWSFVLEENPEEDFDVLAVMSGDNVVMEGLSWATLITTDKVINGLQVSKGMNSIYESLAESKSVKVRLEKEGADGYLLITVKQGESTEEPGGDDEDMTWADDENKKASITVYVNAETGKVIKSEPAMESEGVIDLDKVNSELSGWTYATEDSKPIIVDEESISSVYTFVMDNENLVVGPTESFDAEGLPDAVKVKIENGDKAGYLEIAFEKVIVIDPSDITAGGDDDNDDGIIDENGNLFVLAGTEGEKTVYDSETHELAILKVNGLDEPLRVDEDYTVVYTPKESLVDNLPYHAGTYDVTIKLSDKYITTTGAKEFATTVEITKRDLRLAFSIEENATIEDLNEKLDLADGLVICTPNNLAPNDNLAGVITATFTIGQTPVDGLYPVYPETIHFENTADFDREDYNIMYDYTDLEGIEHQENITPDEDGDVEIGDGEGEIPADEPIGGIEYVDPETGEGSAGGYYEKKYRLYLAVKDKNNYYVEDAEADYKAEGLELFSRRDKKTTWAGGSFTVYYKHNDVVNEGGYRVFIKRGKHADYEEVKLDEVSGYYQIRNVQSDIYVRLYFGTGFPVANEEITATDVRAYAQANKIVVITPEPTDVQIISMAGAVVATDQVTGQREFANLAEGVYIVRMGETVIKLQVRN